MIRSHHLLSCVALATLCLSLPAAAEVLRITSPQQRSTLEFMLDDDGAPRYRVSFDGREVIADSPLGLHQQDVPKTRSWMLQGSRQRRHDRRWRPVVGKTSQARDRYRELEVRLADNEGRRMHVQLRAYDDGIAFRYVLPQAGEVRIRNELTGFAFPRDYRCWALNLGRFGTSHEGEYDPVDASKLRPHNLLELPLVCDAGEGMTFAIAEADLHDYAGLYLSGRADGGLGTDTVLSPRLDMPGVAVVRDGGGQDIATPWRVVMLGSTPGALIESSLIDTLNPPSAIRDTTWIRPGKAAWDWWSGRRAPDVPDAGMNTATMRRYIDHAQSLQLEYMLIDDGWYHGSTGDGRYHAGADIRRAIDAIDLPGLVHYARQRDVGIWLWAHWRALDTDMDAALAWYEQLGIKGIKVDFMDRDDQQMVDFYHRLLASAARHHILVDLHGAYHPTGLMRTYPNFLTQEGVLGAEYNKWTRRITATHNLTLPFTRMLLGPMDYTPGGFRNVTPEAFAAHHIGPQVMTTRAQQLAMFVVYDSPLAVVADSPDAYADTPATQFLRDVPASWDETRVLDGAIGEHIAIARRSGKDWYLGAMANEQARTLTLPLRFLERGRWRATLYLDGDAPDAVRVETRELRAGDGVLELPLAASGGAAVRITPLR